MGFSIKDVLNKCFCFHSQSGENPPSPSPPPPTTTTRTTARSVAAINVQEEDNIEIYVQNEGEEVSMIYKVPLKYLSYTTFRGLLGRSIEDLNRISRGQRINISCNIELFERILKLVKWREVEAKCENLRYDDRLWNR